MSQAIQVDKEVMVLGGAPEAGWVAQGLLGLGYAVQWIPLGATPAGVIPHLRLSLHEGVTLLRLSGHVGGFMGRLLTGNQIYPVKASALVVATGNARYYPAKAYGLPLSARALTTSQLARQLEAPRSTGATLPHRNERIVFLLDLGGETARETATEALRLALRVREAWRAEVNVFYQNLKVDSYGLERLTRAMRERGVVFCRYAQPQIALDDEGVNLSYGEGTLRGDLLVLPEAVRPREDTGEIAALLRVRVGADGYFQDVNIHQYRPGLSVRRGIFFAGRCHMDGDVSDIETDAAQAVANVDALLGGGALEPEEIIAHVDSKKCVRCYTCVRTCPHAAIELADYDQVTAARVVDLACQGCGACVANCPVQAIELVGQSVPAWMQSA